MLANKKAEYQVSADLGFKLFQAAIARTLALRISNCKAAIAVKISLLFTYGSKDTWLGIAGKYLKDFTTTEFVSFIDASHSKGVLLGKKITRR